MSIFALVLNFELLRFIQCLNMLKPCKTEVENQPQN